MANRRFYLTLMFTVGAIVSASSAKADVRIIASSGPSSESYSQGTVLTDDKSLILRENDEVTVLDQKGTRIFRGPGTFLVSGPSRVTGRLGTLTSLATQGDTRRARIGGVRQVPKPKPDPAGDRNATEGTAPKPEE